MLIYEYDSQRIFTGNARDAGPRDPIPRNWTHIAPPETDGFAIFDGVKWFTRDERPTPVVPTTPVAAPIITKLAFRNRFTFEEKVAIETAADTTPSVRVMLKDTEAASFIDLSSQTLTDGLALLVSEGLITQDRAEEVQSGEIQESERPE